VQKVSGTLTRLYQANANMLVIVEGTNYALDLATALELPIVLSHPYRVIYSAHSYSWDDPSGVTVRRPHGQS
jgi:hypothetical protein